MQGSTPKINADHSPLAPNYSYDSSPVSATNKGDARHSNARLNPVHQLPPMLQVTMVAVDEVSAARMGYNDASSDPLLLAKKFGQSANRSKDLLLSGDVESVENLLIAQRANYRILTTNVIVRAAKWSREQAETVTP